MNFVSSDVFSGRSRSQVVPGAMDAGYGWQGLKKVADNGGLAQAWVVIKWIEGHMSENDETPRWLLYTFISSILCVCGALCVPLISYAFKSRNWANAKLVNYGLSLSAGSMLTTSLYKMLPSSDAKKDNGSTIFLGALIGMLLSLGLNYLVHACASESLVHCAHDSESQHQDSHRHVDSQEHGTADQEHGHVVIDSNETDSERIAARIAAQEVAGEETALLKNRNSKEHLLKSKQTLLDLLSTVDPAQLGDCCDLKACVPTAKAESFSCLPPTLKLRTSTTSLAKSSNSQGRAESVSNVEASRLACLENEIGYDYENLPVYREHFHSQRRQSHPHDHNSIESYPNEECHSRNSGSIHSNAHSQVQHHRHHHHLETPFSKLLSIGLQTCIVITLHKFPEGFIIFYTNQSSEVSKALGFSIFLSLSIHNFVEGFSMTLPFYAAFENKFLAILITSALGGLSQPLGALIGYFIFKDRNDDNAGEPHMDAYLSVTAGFLVVIGLQMFQTGVGFSQGHHHHKGEDDDEILDNHTSVNTCLKWCYVGVLLILSGGLFKS